MTHSKTAEINDFRVNVFRIPTESPESDGTIEWDSTIMVVVELYSGKTTGLGYTYAHSAAAIVAKDLIEKCVLGTDVMDIPKTWNQMVLQIRNIGRSGLCSMAISAIDTALWDLKGKILGLSVTKLLGQVRDSVEAYGSGGFTSYTQKELENQLVGWVEQGFNKVKMKVGTHPEDDVSRVKHVRETIGPNVNLFVDANEAYSRDEALSKAYEFNEFGVTWFEQPVHDEDLEGMKSLRLRFPPGMALATGEYAHDPFYVADLIENKVCDFMQVDSTRCQGITGFLKAAAYCESVNMPLSTHCAPALHAAFCLSVKNVKHLEYFFDHVRIEEKFFDEPFYLKNGTLTPDMSRPGLGLEFKKLDAQRYIL